MRELINQLRQKAAQYGVTKANMATVWIVGIMLLSLVAGVTSAQSVTTVTVDSFEDGDIAEYEGLNYRDSNDDTNYFSVITDAPNRDGSVLNAGPDADQRGIISSDGLPAYPRAGDTIEYHHRIDSGFDRSMFIFGQGYFVALRDDEGFGNGGLEIGTQGDTSSPNVVNKTIAPPPSQEWLRIVIHWEESGKIKAFLYRESGTEYANVTMVDDRYDTGDVGFHVTRDSQNDVVQFYWDDVTVTRTDYPIVSGKVVDTDGDPIANATVETDTGVNTTTNSNGEYSLTVQENGTYQINASKTGYLTETEVVEVRGDTEQDFTLQSLNESIEIDTRSFIKHGETAEYEVIVDNGTDVFKVAGEANVTSNNTTVVTVDTIETELVATSNESVNDQTFIRAEYTDAQGRTYVATHDVTVANVTVSNLEILPPIYRFSASVGDDTMFWTIISVLGAIVFTRLSTAFGGISAYVLSFMMGWFAGYVPFGIMLIVVITGAFMGLNLAANINYGAVGSMPGMGRLE